MRVRYVYDFPRPSVTATIGLFVQDEEGKRPYATLIGRRGRKDGAYSGFLCLPGGFLDAKVEMNDVVEAAHDAVQYIEDWDKELADSLVKPGETVEETAIREIEEETGLVISQDRLVLAHVHSDPNTDPRCHVVNICYYVVISNEEADSAVAGDDLEELEMPLNREVESLTLAFNHNEIHRKMLAAVERDFPEL